MTNEEKIKHVFDQFDIEWWDGGKNVTDGWLNVNCPFCGDDPSNHMGTNIESLMIKCWRCGTGGYFTYLVRELTGLPEQQIKEMMGEGSIAFKVDPLDQIKKMLHGKVKKEAKPRKVEIMLPNEAIQITLDTFTPLLEYHMERRDLYLEDLVEHGCYYCEDGEYAYRMIIPIYFEGMLVSYQGMDMTGTSNLKYQTAGGDVNNYLYGYDAIEEGGIMIPTEGLMDQWRYGYPSVCTFGCSLTPRQRKLIRDKKLKELIFLWDGEAYADTKKEAQEMAPYIQTVKIARLPFGHDPDDLGKAACDECIAKAEIL